MSQVLNYEWLDQATIENAADLLLTLRDAQLIDKSTASRRIGEDVLRFESLVRGQVDRIERIILELIRIKQIRQDEVEQYYLKFPLDCADKTKTMKFFTELYYASPVVRQYIGPLQFEKWKHGAVAPLAYQIMEDILRRGLVLAHDEPPRRVLTLPKEVESMLKEDFLPDIIMQDIGRFLERRSYPQITAWSEARSLEREFGRKYIFRTRWLGKLAYQFHRLAENWVGLEASKDVYEIFCRIDSNFRFLLKRGSSFNSSFPHEEENRAEEESQPREARI